MEHIEFLTNKDSAEYAQGRQEYAELFYEECPFPQDTQQRHDWEEGWLDEEAEIVASPA
jgi:ribosome modulation factor